MDNFSPKDAQWESVKYYQGLISYYEDSIAKCDKRFKTDIEWKKDLWKELKMTYEKALIGCRSELKKLLQ